LATLRWLTVHAFIVNIKDPKRRIGTPRSSGADKSTAGAALREAIYDRILRSVLEHRLPPGTKLVEDRLAELFETSRAQIRDVLARLANDGLVQTIPNRGAFIAAPTVEQTRDVFEARRLIEPALVRRLVAQRDVRAVAPLRAIVLEEEQARSKQDRPTMVRLSGEFHIRLAECAGNRMLERAMRELASLTVLAIFLYDARHATACREDEHKLLVVYAQQRAPFEKILAEQGIERGEAAPVGYSRAVGLPQLAMDARGLFPLRGYRFGPLTLPGPRDADALALLRDCVAAVSPRCAALLPCRGQD
jgi:DNA-binding GntR family transcriptional regulator